MLVFCPSNSSMTRSLADKDCIEFHLTRELVGPDDPSTCSYHENGATDSAAPFSANILGVSRFRLVSITSKHQT